MKTYKYFRLTQLLAAGIIFALFLGCERDITDLEEASFPTNPEVFINGFSPGLNYAAFANTVPTAFSVDNQVTYSDNSTASMRFEVPDAGDPRGWFAGGVFFTDSGRDLSGYNALTFWAKATQSATIGRIGFGNDLGENKYDVSIEGLNVTTGWKKYIIPIPDPSRLTAERGLFYYSAGPIDEKGFTFWIDEVKYEKLGTIAHPQFAIMNGENEEATSFIGVSTALSGLTSRFNMPDGIFQAINIAPAYFDFSSSEPSIAVVDERGRITVTGGPGSAQITARAGDIDADGSLTIQSEGEFEHAPIPIHDPEHVISIFSDHYDNVPVDYYNGYWMGDGQTTMHEEIVVNGDEILHYYDFNFFGIQFTSPTVNASEMTHMHLDIYLPNQLSANALLRIGLVDLDANVSGNNTINISADQSQQWISLDIPLDQFTGNLVNRSNLAQIIFVDEEGNIPSFFADNIYFYKDDNGEPPPPVDEPETPAPTPTHPADKVLAIFSDAYQAVPANFFADWGQSTIVSIVQIDGVNTLKYENLNYQGIELESSQDVSDMEYLHLDFWTANSTQLDVFLISPGEPAVEIEYSLDVPTTGWSSIDIPLSSFAPVDMSEVFQLKFDGNGDIFLDNIYFHKD